MTWSNSIILEFLCIYERHPIIWDAKNVGHKNRNEVADAWETIKNELSIKMSVTELKKKRDALMSTYRSIKNKIMISQKSGAGSDEVYKPSWFAFTQMNGFLKSVGKIKPTLRTEEGDFNDCELTDSEAERDEHEKSQVIDEGDNTQQSIEGRDLDDEEHVACVEQPKKTFKSPQKKTLKKKYTTVEDSDTVELKKCMKKASSVLDQTLLRRFAPEKLQDDCSLYGQLLASKLREMEPRKRTIVMNRIDNLVFHFQIEENTSFYSPNVYNHSQAYTQPTSTYSYQLHNSPADLESSQSPASTYSTYCGESSSPQSIKKIFQHLE